MAVNIELFLKQKHEKYQLSEVLRTYELYGNIENVHLRNLFAILQQEFNRLITFMYRKTNYHFNAAESREFIEYIKLYEDMKYILKETAMAFELDEEYEKFILKCSKFLVESGGSSIPIDLENIKLKEYEPIFSLSRTIKVASKKEERIYPLKVIGEGSYAIVSAYLDEFYGKKYIIKRAKKDLTSKELERFKKEFNTMKEFNSPYILEVYRYDESKNEYYAEYMDDTLYDFINKNNNKILLNTRINLALQIFKAFEYIHSKEYLHRDISLTNVLIKQYYHTIIVKISDFGLVKEKNSTLTSTDSEVKGSLNDSKLEIIGFKNYSMVYETYALTRLILFVMTGKTNLEKVENQELQKFVLKGTDGNLENRFKEVKEMRDYFKKIYSI